MLIACVFVFPIACRPAAIPTIPPTAMPLPNYLMEVRPAPSSILSLTAYQERKETDAVYEEHPAPVELIGYRSSVCVHLDVYPLLDNGDKLVDENEVLGRLLLSVDGEGLTDRIPTEYFVRYSDDSPTEISRIENGEEFSAVFHRWGFWFCFASELHPGVHQVRFEYQRLSGVVETYSWQFEITED